jgi:hypothetical protein
MDGNISDNHSKRRQPPLRQYLIVIEVYDGRKKISHGLHMTDSTGTRGVDSAHFALGKPCVKYAKSIPQVPVLSPTTVLHMVGINPFLSCPTSDIPFHS